MRRSAPLQPPALPFGFGDTSSSDESEDDKDNENENGWHNVSDDQSSSFDDESQYISTEYSSSGEEEDGGNAKRQRCNVNPMEQIEALVEENIRSKRREQNQLVNFDPFDHANNSHNTSIKLNGNDNGTDLLDYNPDRLPRQSICYDYNRQPLGIVERKREFLPQVDQLSIPLLRPIIIDGLGLIKAYWEECDDDAEAEEGDSGAQQSGPNFPFHPIVRCLFYWIARGHFTQICFPINFSPMSQSETYGATDKQNASLKLLQKLGVVDFFDVQQTNMRWFIERQDSIRGCLLTSIAHFLSGMQSNLDHDQDYKSYGEVQTCPDRTLQPFFGPKGDMVFFTSISGNRKEFVVDMVLDNDIKTEQQFHQFKQFQLSFIDQAKQLKVLYDLLPEGKRIREAPVMHAVLERLKKFL